MRTEVFVLSVKTAAAAYLSYYVLATGGGYFAWMSAVVIDIHVFSAWSITFYKLGRKSARSAPRAEKDR